MSIVTEYKESGTKAWKVIFAPVWILLQIAKITGQAIIGRDGPIPPHINIPLHKSYDNEDD